jgi:hypothetical protein
MKVSLAAAAALLFLSSVPSWAIETVTLPQNSDGTPAFQNPDAQAQSKFSTDQNGNTDVGGLGKFHFSMQSGSGYDRYNSPGYFYHPGQSSEAGYGNANEPGSEFFNNGVSPPH